MVIIDSYVAITLVVLTVAAAVAAGVLILAAVARVAMDHRSRRRSRRESIPAYYRSVALGH
jgi:hypothetical protein